ncbi:histone acetyltransferase HAC12-like [Bidens hawaiensis]|uniref:histone acetyltransferase HAC12-like n=1 Tax=Bidens hawaiensis TaxID=980011 RepID=UPI00404B9277
MTKSLCSDHDHLSSKEMIIDEKEKYGEAVIKTHTDSSSAADVADLTSNKSMTPDVSMVDCDSVLETDHTKIKIASLAINEMIKSAQLFSDHHSSKEMIIDEKEKSGTDEADLNSNKFMTPNVSTMDCDSVLESDNTKIKTASLTDNDSQLEPKKIKIQSASVSLADFFTADQIKAHLLSFTSQKASSSNRAPSVGPNTCHLCSNDKLVFAPTPMYCSSCETRIKRNVGYYRTAGEIGTRHCFCISCYRGTHGNNILMRGYGYPMPKSNLQRARNDEEKEDSWVLCDKCQNWQHRICGLYNDEKDVEGKAEYICPKCYLQELESGIRVPLSQSTTSGAKDLPRTNLSDHIEQRLFERLNQERQEMAKVSGIKPSEVPMAEGLVVRVVVSVEKHLEVRQKFRSILHGEDYPSGFTYRSKLIFLFQKIEGVDVCLFGMCVQEFGSECGGPNNRCVYISYLDSVKYFRPERKCVTGESLRTFVYHEILIGYLDYCKKRGFTTCYIWACPLVKGEDYIFYCHPETQRTPKQDKLRQWYKLMLKKATEANVVIDHTNLYSQFFVPGEDGNNMKITAARLPYFDGDYWSVAAETHVRKLELEETAAGGLQSKLPNKRILKAMGQDKADIAVKDVLVMHKLGQTILSVKENFMIVLLQHTCTHCRDVILSGSRWFCSHCNKIQLCSRCFNADKNISESKLHTCHSGERNQLSEVVVNDVTLDTKDTDDVFVNSFFETRDAFLNKCQKSHFQFDTLSRAKYSSMMILYHLIYKPVTKPTCTACYADVVVGQCFYCDTCPKYYICESCYRLRHGAYHPHRLYPPSLDIDCMSKSLQLQMQRDWQFKIMLNTLMHASDCDRIPCAYKECNTIRRLFSHAVRCSVKPRADCKFCRRVWLILRLHSQICTDSDCKIPRCMDIKKHRGMLAARPASEHVTINVD